MSYYAALFSSAFDGNKGPGAEGIHLVRGSLVFLNNLAIAIQSDAQIPPSSSHRQSKWELRIRDSDSNTKLRPQS